jgi:D-arabinose 1-dehydrogenase-like Zn-dependent alcohol dehydrogenase
MKAMRLLCCGEPLALAAGGKVACRIEQRPLAEANTALEDLRSGRVLGRIVLVP